MWYLAAYPYISFVATIVLGIINNLCGINESTVSLWVIALEFVLLVIPYIAAFIVSVKCQKSATGKKAAIVKLAHIPFYVGNFIYAVCTIFVVVPTIGAFFLALLTVIPSGIYMAGVKDIRTVEKVLGFVFVADVVVACKLMAKERLLNQPGALK